MLAGMAFTNCLQSIFRELLPRSGVMQEPLQLCLHLASIMDHQVVLARAKELFLIAPGRAHQRNSASQRFKNADRRYSRESIRVLPARYVHRDHALGIDLR